MNNNDKLGYFGIHADWIKRVAAPHPEFHIALNNASCLIEYWAPRTPDGQKPHDRDEVYVIIAGHSEFLLDGHRRNVKAGDLIFVPAGTHHCFERFSDDLAMWVVFFGERHQAFEQTP